MLHWAVSNLVLPIAPSFRENCSQRNDKQTGTQIARLVSITLRSSSSSRMCFPWLCVCVLSHTHGRAIAIISYTNVTHCIIRTKDDSSITSYCITITLHLFYSMIKYLLDLSVWKKKRKNTEMWRFDKCKYFVITVHLKIFDNILFFFQRRSFLINWGNLTSCNNFF